jgi:phosphoribosylformimino-5-aminoimidazole carboxamide ribotide isomerase
LQGGNRDTNSEIIRAVSSKAETMLDFGVSSPDDAEKALSIANTAIIGTETGTIAVIRETATLHPGRISVSIDIKHGKVLKQDPEIPSDPFEIVEALNGLPLKDLILLDMDRVGTASGFDPAFLKELALRSKHDVLLGGGVRSMENLYALGKIGVKGALVATAVHNGSIPLEWLKNGPEIE